MIIFVNGNDNLKKITFISIYNFKPSKKGMNFDMKEIENNIFEIEIKDIKNLFKERPLDSHKGMFGTVGIMGGSLEYSGSIKLSSITSAAVRGGAGIVRVIVPENIATSISPYLLEQTLYPLKCDENNHILFSNNNLEDALKGLNALALGMGWGKSNEYTKIIDYIIKNFSGKLLIDADGINTLSQMDLNILKNTPNQIILTPHLKEFERLTKINVEEIKQNSIQIAKNFAKKYNVILLLKGATTIVTDGKKVYLIKKAVPGMATAGSGDVLSGILVGMLGYQDANILTVASGALLACIAGEFAQKKYTDISMKAQDTIENIPTAIKYIREY